MIGQNVHTKHRKIIRNEAKTYESKESLPRMELNELPPPLSTPLLAFFCAAVASRVRAFEGL